MLGNVKYSCWIRRTTNAIIPAELNNFKKDLNNLNSDTIIDDVYVHYCLIILTTIVNDKPVSHKCSFVMRFFNEKRDEVYKPDVTRFEYLDDERLSILNFISDINEIFGPHDIDIDFFTANSPSDLDKKIESCYPIPPTIN